MRVYIEDDKGNKIECERVDCIGEGDIVIISEILLNESHLRKLEMKLTDRLDRKVIILQPYFKDIRVLPPKI